MQLNAIKITRYDGANLAKNLLHFARIRGYGYRYAIRGYSDMPFFQKQGYGDTPIYIKNKNK